MLASAKTAGVSKTRTSDVKETLLDWIRQGKYPPGSQLPSVPDLVNRLEVSRTVVREALQSLVGMNFIEIRPGLGCFVKSIPADLIVNADVMAALIDLNTLIQVASARKVIEGAAARVAVVMATEEDFERIEEVLDRIKRLARHNQPMYSVTPDFHTALARATHNDVLESVISSFNALMVAAGEIIEAHEIGQAYRNQEYISHAGLYEILKLRNANKAQAAMEEHIEKTVERLTHIQTLNSRKEKLTKMGSYR